MLDGDGGPALGDAVERLDLVEPFALDHTLLQIKARRGLVAGRPAPGVRLDRHVAKLRWVAEQNKNIRLGPLDDALFRRSIALSRHVPTKGTSAIHLSAGDQTSWIDPVDSLAAEAAGVCDPGRFEHLQMLGQRLAADRQAGSPSWRSIARTRREGGYNDQVREPELARRARRTAAPGQASVRASAYSRRNFACSSQPPVLSRSADSRRASGNVIEAGLGDRHPGSIAFGFKVELDGGAQSRLEILVSAIGAWHPFVGKPTRRLHGDDLGPPRITFEAGIGHLAGRLLRRPRMAGRARPGTTGRIRDDRKSPAIPAPAARGRGWFW